MARGMYFTIADSAAHDTGAGHPERAARIEAIEARLAACDWAGYERREAPAASRAQLCAVHDETYVDAVRAFCDAGGGVLAEDTAVSPGSYRVAAAASGAACAMAEALLAGEAPVGFCATRP